MANKPTYHSLEQRISFLEQELREKNEKLSLLTSNFENESKLAQEKAHESERSIQVITSNFESFFNAIDDFVFVVDEHGNIVHCNETVEKRLGYTLEELKGKSILSVHPEERRSETERITADAVAGKIASFQIPLVTKQGKHIYVETHANYGIWNGKPSIFGVSKDITKLKLSEEKFSTVFYINPSACSLSEVDTGRYIEVNDAFYKLFGFTREEAIGHNAIELQIMSEIERNEILSKADNLGRIYNVETKLKTKNGEIKSVLMSSQNIHIQDHIYRYAVVHDVTETYKARQIAEENENKFSIAFHSSPSVSLITNIDTGEILEANEAVEQVAGYSRAEMIGKSAIDMNLWMIDGDRSKFVEMLTRDRKILNFESKFRKKSGEAFTGLLSGQMIQIQNQNCILSIINDISDLKRIENDLIQAKEIAEENERKFSKLLDSCPEPLTVTTIEDGCILITNEAFRNATGYGREEIINHKSLELNIWLSAEDRQKWVDELTKNGSVRSIEFQLRTKKYGIRDFLISSDIIMLDKKKCAFTFYIDITDRKKAEIELLKAKDKVEESEEKFKNLYESLSISYLILKDGVCIECNGATLTIYGAESKDDVIGKSPLDFAPEFQSGNLKSSDEAHRQIQTTIEKGSHTFEWIALRNNKKEAFFAEISLKKFYYKNELYLQCLTTDITERKKIEIEIIEAKEKAEENEKKYKDLFLNMINAFALHEMIFNDNGEPIDYVFLEVNPIWEQVVGIKAETVIGKRIKEIMPEIEQSWIDRYGRIVLTGTPDEFIDYNEATQKYYNVFAYKHEGNTFAAFFNDITDKKQAEIELIKAKEKAEESDHLKTAFLQNMSHEIRTPLNAICGFSSFLGDENLSPHKRKSFVQIIQNSSDQLLSVVSDILMISSLETKQEKTDISDVCLNDIIIELQTIFKQQAKNRNISIYAKQQLTDKQSEIYTDKTKVTEIISNLLSNSLKFTHTGSIEFGYQLINNEIEFYVKDSGIGIKPELHDKIFERFRQADNTIQRNYGGTGLGLSICKGLVELLGGKIWVKSDVGKGSTFYFTIPYKPVNEIDKITSPVKQNKYFKTILIAEDDEYNFAFIEEVLSHFPVKLFHAKDGKQAIEIFKLNPQIDLILMDIKMPVMNGYEAAKIIKSINPEMPVIAQSAYAMDYERVRYEAVFDDYLSKPIKEDTLIKVFSRFVHAE